MIATEFDYRIQYNRFRVVLHVVDSLNVKHELRSIDRLRPVDSDVSKGVIATRSNRMKFRLISEANKIEINRFGR